MIYVYLNSGNVLGVTCGSDSNFDCEDGPHDEVIPLDDSAFVVASIDAEVYLTFIKTKI